MDAITIPGTRGFPCAVSGFESSRPRSFFLLRRSCLRPNIASKTSGIQGTITTVRRWICRVKLENWSFTYLKQVWRKQFPVDIIFVAFLEIWSAYHLNGIFGSFFWTNGAAIFSSKETNWIDWTVSFDRNFRMPVGRGLGTSHQVTWWLNLTVVLDVLSDDSENNLFGEDYDNFICLAAAASTFLQGNQQSASTFFPTM